MGVLALQGDVREHTAALTVAGATVVPVKRPTDLDGLDGIVLPDTRTIVTWSAADHGTPPNVATAQQLVTVKTTNTPPTTSSSSSVRVTMDSPASSPPSASDPVSPMKIRAGEAFHHRKPIQPPIAAAATIAMSSGSRTS